MLLFYQLQSGVDIPCNVSIQTSLQFLFVLAADITYNLHLLYNSLKVVCSIIIFSIYRLRLSQCFNRYSVMMKSCTYRLSQAHPKILTCKTQMPICTAKPTIVHLLFLSEAEITQNINQLLFLLINQPYDLMYNIYTLTYNALLL